MAEIREWISAVREQARAEAYAEVATTTTFRERWGYGKAEPAIDTTTVEEEDCRREGRFGRRAKSFKNFVGRRDEDDAGEVAQIVAAFRQGVVEQAEAAEESGVRVGAERRRKRATRRRRRKKENKTETKSVEERPALGVLDTNVVANVEEEAADLVAAWKEAMVGGKDVVRARKERAKRAEAARSHNPSMAGRRAKQELDAARLAGVTKQTAAAREEAAARKRIAQREAVMARREAAERAAEERAARVLEAKMKKQEEAMARRARAAEKERNARKARLDRARKEAAEEEARLREAEEREAAAEEKRKAEEAAAARKERAEVAETMFVAAQRSHLLRRIRMWRCHVTARIEGDKARVRAVETQKLRRMLSRWIDATAKARAVRDRLQVIAGLRAASLAEEKADSYARIKLFSRAFIAWRAGVVVGKMEEAARREHEERAKLIDHLVANVPPSVDEERGARKRTKTGRRTKTKTRMRSKGDAVGERAVGERAVGLQAIGFPRMEAREREQRERGEMRAQKRKGKEAAKAAAVVAAEKAAVRAEKDARRAAAEAARKAKAERAAAKERARLNVQVADAFRAKAQMYYGGWLPWRAFMVQRAREEHLALCVRKRNLVAHTLRVWRAAAKEAHAATVAAALRMAQEVEADAVAGRRDRKRARGMLWLWRERAGAVVRAREERVVRMQAIVDRRVSLAAVRGWKTALFRKKRGADAQARRAALWEKAQAWLAEEDVV